MREITFDTETTGIDPASGHRIVEIGCVELIDKTRTGKFFHTYLNPQRNVPKSATDIHGLTDVFLSDKPLFKNVAKEFVDFISDSTLVIHNAAFDMKFINFELENAGMKTISISRAVDTLTMARNKFPGNKASLDALCQKFGIDLSRRDKHGALLDAELLADVYQELCGGKQSNILFASASQVVEEGIKIIQRKIRKKREYQVSQEEAEAHTKFMEKIKNPIWAEYK